MVSTTTKKYRPKRSDERPNGKRRNEGRTKVMESKTAEELRATSIPSSKRKEREVSGVLRQVNVASSDDIRSRALQKLLRQIEALGERQRSGDKLEAAQLKKLGRLDEVIAEIEELLDVDLGSDDDDDDKSEGEDQSSIEEKAMKIEAENNENKKKTSKAKQSNSSKPRVAKKKKQIKH